MPRISPLSIDRPSILLDQVHCARDTRLFDIGCGYGRILGQAARRGAKATGITISPPQVAYGSARGLDVRELNYRNIFHGDEDWEGGFDAVVANGSLEHFVQVADAAAGRSDEIYEEMFAICRRLLRDGGRLVTTAIHFRRQQQVRAHSSCWSGLTFMRAAARIINSRWCSSGRLAAGIRSRANSSGVPPPYFELVAEEDGTHDYHLTSEYWLRRQQWSTAFNPRIWWALVGKSLSQPTAVMEMLRCLAWDQSWAWQFRPPAPTRLLRQTWLAK